MVQHTEVALLVLVLLQAMVEVLLEPGLHHQVLVVVQQVRALLLVVEEVLLGQVQQHLAKVALLQVPVLLLEAQEAVLQVPVLQQVEC